MSNLPELLELIRQDDERAARQKQQAEEMSVGWLCGRHPLLGGEYYRALRPAALTSRKYDWHTACASWMGTPEGQEGGPLHLITQNQHVICPKVIIVRPIKEWSVQWTEQAHRNGQAIIADIDDDVWAHEDWREGGRPNDDHFDDWFWQVDAVLTSTSTLARKIRRLGHKAPVYVAPNCYDPVGLAGEPKPGKTIGTRLWLSGRMSKDLELYRSLFMPLVSDLDLKWAHLGREQRTGDVGEAAHGIETFAQLGCPGDRLIELPSQTVPDMAKTLAERVSIGAIAMADDPYNEAKTETHAMELASVGLPLVAATNHELYLNIPGRVPPYGPTVRARVAELLDPVIWQRESEKARAWAQERAITLESAYLETIGTAVLKAHARV